MNFCLLDPRKVEAAEATNQKIFSNAPEGLLGIEVTIPALAGQCSLGNIDPQHSGGRGEIAAIEVAISHPIPAEGVVLATVRADLDSVGSMAVLSMRAQGVDLALAMDRIKAVAAADKSKTEGWQGPRALPTPKSPWADAPEKPLAAIAAAVGDFRVPLGERVALMEQWLLTGEEPVSYRERVERERLEMAEALASGQIQASLMGRVAVIVSTHRAATGVGYMLAPLVVALNPEFRFQGGEPHRKFTVCQFSTGYCDISGALLELSELEEGWGGSPTIGGSPQGVSSTLTTEQVVEVVTRHIK